MLECELVVRRWLRIPALRPENAAGEETGDKDGFSDVGHDGRRKANAKRSACGLIWHSVEWLDRDCTGHFHDYVIPSLRVRRRRVALNFRHSDRAMQNG